MSPRRRILLVANSGWNIYNFRQGLIRRLLGNHCEVWVAAPEDAYFPKLQRLFPQLHWVALRHLRAQHYAPVQDLLLMHELWKLYRSQPFDSIWHFTIKPNIYGSLAARLAGRHSIATVTGLGYTFVHRSWRNALVRPLYRLALRRADQVFFHNPDDRALFLNLGIVRESGSEVVGGSGIDTDYYVPQERTQGRGFIFLLLGRLLYSKGLWEYAEAARLLREQGMGAEFWVAGATMPDAPDGIPDSELQLWVDAGWLRYFGHSEDVRNLIRDADVLVLPSYREGVPRALLEGMAMGKPVISTDVPGCREVVNPGFNGLLVPPRDAVALAEAMWQLYRYSDAERIALGGRGRQLVLDRFSEEQVFGRYWERIA